MNKQTIEIIIEYADDIKALAIQHSDIKEDSFLFSRIYRELKKAKHPIVTSGTTEFDFKSTAPVALATMDIFLPMLNASLEGYENAHATAKNIQDKTLDTVDTQHKATYNTLIDATPIKLTEQNDMFAATENIATEPNNILSRLAATEASLKSIKDTLAGGTIIIKRKREKKPIVLRTPDVPKNYKGWTVSQSKVNGQYRIVRRVGKKICTRAIGQKWDQAKADVVIERSNRELGLNQ